MLFETTIIFCSDISKQIREVKTLFKYINFKTINRLWLTNCFAASEKSGVVLGVDRSSVCFAGVLSIAVFELEDTETKRYNACYVVVLSQSTY